MPTVHSSVRMTPATHTGQASQMPQRAPPQGAQAQAMAKQGQILTGKWALFLELGQRITIALELICHGYPEMRVTGSGSDPTNNRYGVTGFWNMETNAFQLTLDLTKLGKRQPKIGRPVTRAFPTISLFGIREPQGIKFSGEAHTCAGLGPFGMMTFRELEYRKHQAKNLKKGRGDPKKIAYALNGGNSNQGSYIGNVKAPLPRHPPTASLPHRTGPPPRVGIARAAPQTARARAATASPATMAGYTQQYRQAQEAGMNSARGMGSEYHSQIGYFSQEAQNFQPDASAFGAALNESRQAAQQQAQVRARATSNVTSPDAMRRQQTHTFGEFGDVASAGFAPDHSADGFDDEEYEALLALSPNGPNPARALAAQRAALEAFAANAKKTQETLPTNSTNSVDVKKRDKSESPKKSTACYGIGDSDDEDEAPQQATKAVSSKPRGAGEPPLPGQDDGETSPGDRPEWMDTVFDDEDDDHETIEL